MPGSESQVRKENAQKLEAPAGSSSPAAAASKQGGSEALPTGTKSSQQRAPNLTVATNGSTTDKEREGDAAAGMSDKVSSKKSLLLAAHKSSNSASSSPRIHATASPRVYKRKRDSVEDDDSDEEALWNRAMKQAEKLAQWEHSETIKARKAAEQAALNESFFSRGSKKEDADLGMDVNANLLVEADFSEKDLAITRAEALHKILEQVLFTCPTVPHSPFENTCTRKTMTMHAVPSLAFTFLANA
jgi:hypothetical protein